MIERVDFYILGDVDGVARLRYACRIAQKAYLGGLKVYLQTEGPEHDRELDMLMWTFSQGSFVPHTISNDMREDWANYPVQLGSGLEQNRDADLLVSLVSEIPRAYEQFRRIVDLVTDAPKDKAAGRKRFRFYRDKGIEPNTHLVA